MAWQLIGESEPGFDWVIFSPTVVDDVILKVDHTWDSGYPFPGSGYALLADFFANGERHKIRRIYPTPDPTIMTFAVNDVLRNAGLTIRQMGIKRNIYARIFGDANWQIRVDQWV